MRNRESEAQAVLRPCSASARYWLLLPMILLMLAAGMARAQDDDLIVTHGISTFGDLRYGPDFEHLDYVNPDAPKGGEMSFSWSSAGGSFDSLHPFTREGRPAVLSSIFFESMLEGTADEIGSAYCLLCETLAYPEDRSFVIFTIREGAAFSDGTPVTADDALFSYEILRDEGLPSFRASIGRTIAGAEVLDDRRIRFDFNPEAPLRGRIQSAGGLPVFSRASHDASGYGFSEARLEPLMGSAPYVLHEVESGQRTVFRRNPDYWGNDLPINQGRYNFDRIRIEYYGDAVAAFEGFTAGNYLFRQESSSVNWATSYDFPALDRGHVVKAELPDGTISTGQSFVINLRREKFQDARVREAIALMFNFAWTNETLFYGLYEWNDSFWQNTDLVAEGLPSEAELVLLEPLRDQLRPEVFTEEPFSLPASNPDRALDRRQARRAIGLLEEAGWVVGDDGMVRNGAGQTLDVEFLNSGPMFDRLINPYVENLRTIGINARLTRVDSAQMTQREREYDFDIITDHIPMAYEPGAGLRQYFGSQTANTSVFNPAGLADPAIDALVEHVIDAETREELSVSVAALDRVLRWERFRVPQWFNNAHWVAYYDIYRYPEPLPPFALGFLDFWWVDAEAEAALREAGAF
ncbi:ABC transporter substrate-binding protein [Roseobacter sp. HKCCD9010]|uniref:extracellular solute-binding protein n=4 Tax=unclassified Roseobacter TaxID=196798 RepID=UPI00149218AB|nr:MULTISPECIES: extracellular solute-binding protein [unclassified Roseobacter]MBF9048755.1 ABC transporter substrate-binding protein [Rhodobacterales bacterium HKCCD4356]NNV14939.1 ABC transporter substrate-binding protein [Roseobacter sp. HKCCD8768]NNV32928.1 ABC transporter substrate-binding protein [Roseobacter sp. HKCCD9073]NNV37179.1 ABC transporter substrate-binding protein [Roseobacter sp. HKCCD9054]NNV45386.1 ABC transporter substrate-binding protein [Roseobacter sp. HKCCD6265]NNV66